MLPGNQCKTSRAGFYLVLVLVVGLLAGTAVKLADLMFSYPDTLDSTLDLDSFSEASIARAILKKHAQSLILASVADRETLYYIVTQPKAGDLICTANTNSTAGYPAQDEARLKSRIDHWIEQHQTELKKQKEIWAECPLEYELLLLYKTNHRWEEFVDCYLNLLGATPNHHIVTTWVREALTYSGACGRTEELLDALQHLARFHRDPSVVEKIKAILARWETENNADARVQAPDP